MNNPESIRAENKEDKILKGYHFIYFGPEKWDGLWRNRHHLMTRFSKFNKILYVEPRIGLKRIRRKLKNRELNWRDFRNSISHIHCQKVINNLFIYNNPIFLPFSGRPLIDRLSQILWQKHLQLNLKKIGIKNPIIWLSKPQMVDLVEKFKEKLVIYHVVDEYTSYSGLDKNQQASLKKIEKRMLKKADLVIVVSKNLFLTKKHYNSNTYIIPNGVNYQQYEKAMQSNAPLPEDIARVKGPIIGYSGLISARLDLELIIDMAITQTNWSIVLIGQINDEYCSDEMARLRQIKNVHFLGSKDIVQVPYYVKVFDVCIIPYKINQHSKNVSPLKLYDFLATGKPIVTTNFTAANDFKNVVYVENSKAEFIASVRDALKENDRYLIDKRKEIAAENTWDKRVEQLSKIIKLNHRFSTS